ncbi:hypothetical protein AAE478_002006 [Parahypoxylon ruwenzoriense]
MTSPQPKIGIISLGDMGAGIARLLIAHGFSVATNVSERSSDTVERARAAGVELLGSDAALVAACPVVLSVVPPRDAEATAQRVLDALTGPGPPRSRSGADDDEPLYFADLNAVAPSSVKRIAALFEKTRASRPVRFVDGCILGLPPALRAPVPADAGASSAPQSDGSDIDATWKRPSIPTSGPHSLSLIPGYGPHLSSVLNMRHISPSIGGASGLKMCFASISKGLTSLAIQSVTTAHKLGVLGELEAELRAVLPQHYGLMERGVVGMAPKAYRWVGEMEEIARTLSEEGGFAPDSFLGAAKVYRAVAEDTVLGRERIGKRSRGTTVEDVAAAMAEGMATKRKKND